MSKNTSSSAFRKIDVDQYNEDNYKEDECGESQSPPVGPDEKEIINFLNQYPFIKNVLKVIIIILKAKVLFVIFLNLIFFYGEEY
jgi:actin related protein 2/3 complex subunit 5